MAVAYARVKFQYQPQADDELALEVGTIINVLEQYDDGWWKGELNGFEGVFPENHVELIDVARHRRTRPNVPQSLCASGNNNRMEVAVTARPNVMPDVEGPASAGMNPLFQARALYQYKAQAEDQLDLEEGDIITVVQELEHGWWAGTINGKAGIFPASFTEKIDSSTAANPFANTGGAATMFGSGAGGDDANELKAELLRLQSQFKDAMEVIDQQHNDQLKLIAIVADLKDELNQLKQRK